MSAITLTFTFPPSANAIWRNFGGRTIKSAAYRAWLDLNKDLAIGQRFKPIDGPYVLTLLAHAPDRRKRDLGNLEKPVSDLLQQIGAVTDDCNAKEIRLAWVEGPGSGVTVTVEPIQ